MCGADHGPEHDDPLAAEVCDLYHALYERGGRPAIARLSFLLGDHEREVLWHLAVGVGPDGLARRFGSEVSHVRGELNDLARRLESLGAAPA